jgi:hypothetical protein
VTFLSGSNNAVLFNNCQSLQNLTVSLRVTQDLITVNNSGFSLQLNCYPQPGIKPQGQTLTEQQVGDLSLTWFQYVVIVQNGWSFEIQYWSNNAKCYQQDAAGNCVEPWPPGYNPNPPGTTPWLPVFPNTALAGGIGSSSSSQLLAGSIIEIQLTTDSNSNVVGANFRITDPSGNVSTPNPQPSFPTGAQFPIYGFQVDLVAPPSSFCTFQSGAGVLTYSVSPAGTLSVQSTNTCSPWQPGTGENSNAVYGTPTPSTGSTVSQTFNVPPMSMAFNFGKSTFGQDEVAQTPTWGSAYWLAISGFPNASLGFNSPSNLNAQPNPLPAVTAAINTALNPGLNHFQIATIANNLPSVNGFGLPPVLAIDDTLGLNFQTFMYPFTISFPNLNAFNALNPHQAAVVTLTANFTVQVPTGVDSQGPTTTPVPVSCLANIELAKGEDPYLINLNPQNPQAYPSWLSFDLRLFTVTANQAHEMFSVGNPTTGDPSSPNGPITYIQTVINHLNNPSLITNGDTFDATLTQDEDSSALEFLPTNNAGEPVFNFAVARVRITSSIKTTIGPVRVFFRLFNAASTVSDFAEVGTGEGTYRWGADGTPGHKIALLGIQGFPGLTGEYVTIPCFATDRVNRTQPADMNTQHDTPNAPLITTAPGQEVDTYFGCWLDVNQTTTFLIPTPPLLPSLWDGPWVGTESLNGAIAVAPHQCVVAEIRFDDTPIPNGATTSTSDKLAQRNIAWLDGP